MNDIIQAFLNKKQLAIAGASPNSDNFGLSLMKELEKLEHDVFPVNPRYQEIGGKVSIPTVRDLPETVDSLILAVPPAITEEIVEQCADSPIKRVWMVRGVGKGAFSEKAYQSCKANGIEVVYGFCPMMFYGKGMHRFHLWLRKTFGKLPEEYSA